MSIFQASSTKYGPRKQRLPHTHVSNYIGKISVSVPVSSRTLSWTDASHEDQAAATDLLALY